jgi:hypothetical protein
VRLVLLVLKAWLDFKADKVFKELKGHKVQHQ